MKVLDSAFPLVDITELVEIQIGKTPSRSESKYFGEGYTWISISDMKGEKFIGNSKEELTEIGVKASKIRVVPANTILYSFKLSIGKVSITTKDLYTNEAIAAFPIKCQKRLDLNYFYYVMKSFDFTDGGVNAVMGKTLNKKTLSQIKIPLPPLPIQRKITEALDKADAIRKRSQQILAKYDQLAQSVFLEMFGDPVKNEKGWDVKSIGEISDVKIGPFGSLLHAEDYISGGTPLVNPSHIVNSRISVDDNLTIDNQKLESLSSYQLKAGDIVIGRRGEIGRCAIVEEHQSGFLCGTGSMFIRLKKDLIPLFLQRAISSVSGKLYLESKSKGVTMKNLNSGTISEMRIISPPLSVQNQFASIISRLEKQKSQTQMELDRAEELYQSLLQKAFSGELFNSPQPFNSDQGDSPVGLSGVEVHN